MVGEIKKRTAGGVVLAADVSAKTEKEVLYYANQCNIDAIKVEFSMDEAKQAIGKRAGVFFVLDEGLFSSIKNSANIQ